MDVDKAVAAAKDAFENGEWGRMNARDRGRLMYRYDFFKSTSLRTSLVVQWLRFHAPNAEGPGLIPGQGTRSHMLQRRVCILPRKDLAFHNLDLCRKKERLLSTGELTAGCGPGVVDWVWQGGTQTHPTLELHIHSSLGNPRPGVIQNSAFFFSVCCDF